MNFKQQLPQYTAEQMADFLYSPIELPRGTRSIDHCCAVLLEDGYTEEEATKTLVLVQEDGGWWFARCTECGTAVRAK